MPLALLKIDLIVWLMMITNTLLLLSSLLSFFLLLLLSAAAAVATVDGEGGVRRCKATIRRIGGGKCIATITPFTVKAGGDIGEIKRCTNIATTAVAAAMVKVKPWRVSLCAVNIDNANTIAKTVAFFRVVH